MQVDVRRTTGPILDGSANRRAFLGSAVAIGVGSALIPFDVTPAAAEHQRPDDPILAHITNEAARVARAFQGQPRPDDYRALAVNNRLFMSYVRSKDLDAAIKKHMTDLVRQRGKRTIVNSAMGQEMAAHRRHLLSAYGVHIHDGNIPADVYARQLDVMLLKGGLSEMLNTTAVTLDAMFGRMQKTIAPHAARVLPVQSDVEKQLQCGHLTSQCNIWSAYATMFCIGGYWAAFLNPVCAAAMASAGGYCGAAAYYGCY